MNPRTHERSIRRHGTLPSRAPGLDGASLFTTSIPMPEPAVEVRRSISERAVRGRVHQTSASVTRTDVDSERAPPVWKNGAEITDLEEARRRGRGPTRGPGFSGSERGPKASKESARNSTPTEEFERGRSYQATDLVPFKS